MRTLAGADRLLFRVVRDGGGWTVTLVVVALAGAAAELALPAVLGLAVDAAVGGDAAPRWPVVACVLVVVLLVTDVLGDLTGGHGAARHGPAPPEAAAAPVRAGRPGRAPLPGR
ncbi:hypothetical protein [Verrucosispora sioxanthis]|uniref:hypothetical protein n=1 Tax=Verrucosispora sioxanthis TaxID=2499994 RepID=UPI001F393064|nr:hypothetical protein [Verrucosispora sioxanthis]